MSDEEKKDKQQTRGLDSVYKELDPLEVSFWEIALSNAAHEAANNRHKHPKWTTLMEEIAELTLALRGKHDHSVELELMQVAGVAINLLAQVYAGQLDHINNARTQYNDNDSSVSS